MAKEKIYSLSKEAIASDGTKHVVTVVGMLEQSRPVVEDKINFRIREAENRPLKTVTVSVPQKVCHRRLTLGVAICHPDDTFDENYGIHLATRRIKAGDNKGVLTSDTPTMLTKDNIMANIQCKLDYYVANIDTFITKK